jgi:hypothetical protein
MDKIPYDIKWILINRKIIDSYYDNIPWYILPDSILFNK